MKKIVSLLLGILLCGLLTVPVLAAPEGPVITLQPQSPNYPEYSVASYTVRASGNNLRATWYLEWQGATYNLSDNTNGIEPWEGFAGESYGGAQEDANTFIYFFSGIERDLDGAYIWCVIEDGHYDVKSQRARVSIGNENSPPVIEDIPANLTVAQGENAEIRCIALAPGDTQLSFLWYETDTGRMEDMRAVNRGTETSDFLFCDTSQVGTRNYLCKVETSDGGLAYSSIVQVTVTERAYVPEPPSILTNVLPQAEVGKAYSAKLSCTDPGAEFSLYYSPGGANDFERIGLTLARDGTISGTPTVSGSFSFSVCAANAGGEDYMTYELIVKEAPIESTTEPADTPETTTPEPKETSDATLPSQSEPEAVSDATRPSKLETEKQEAPDSEEDDEPDAGVPWWALMLIGVAAAGVGVGTAIVLIQKKS